jgi:hypothetical protein
MRLREYMSGGVLGKGEMKGSDGVQSKLRKEFGDSRRARSGRVGQIVRVSSIVDEWCSELEEGEGGTAENGEGDSVGLEEDLKEKLGREAGNRRRRLAWRSMGVSC